MPLNDTWFAIDLPVLEKAVAVLDDEQYPVATQQLANSLAMEHADVVRALKRLEGEYVEVIWMTTSDGPIGRVKEVSAGARREVGQWPSPDALVERLIAELERRVETATDDEERTRWQRLLDGAKGVGSNALSQLVAQAVWQGAAGAF